MQIFTQGSQRLYVLGKEIIIKISFSSVAQLGLSYSC